jgi:hypothetical protein
MQIPRCGENELGEIRSLACLAISLQKEANRLKRCLVIFWTQNGRTPACHQ